MRKFFLVRNVALCSGSVSCFPPSLLGCRSRLALSPQYSDKPAAKEDQDERKSPEVTGVGAAVDSATYKVGPADILQINVWNEPNFTANT